MATNGFRRSAFTSVIVVLLLAFVTVLGLGLSMVVVGWLPDDTLQAILDPRAPTHRFHALGIGWLYTIPLIGVLVQLRKPAAKTAPMQQTVLAVLAIVLIAVATRTFSAEALIFLALIAAAALLHPRRRELIGLGKPDVSMGILAVVAAMPWLVYTSDHISLQLVDRAGDIHAAVDHWALMASLAVVIVGTSLVGSGFRSGWRISAWTAGSTTIAFGVASMLYPNAASTASTGWAATAIIWAIVYLIAAERRHQLDKASKPQSSTPPSTSTGRAGDMTPGGPFRHIAKNNVESLMRRLHIWIRPTLSADNSIKADP